MIAEASLPALKQTRTEESDLLECMRKIGKGLIASGGLGGCRGKHAERDRHGLWNAVRLSPCQMWS